MCCSAEAWRNCRCKRAWREWGGVGKDGGSEGFVLDEAERSGDACWREIKGGALNWRGDIKLLDAGLEQA